MEINLESLKLKKCYHCGDACKDNSILFKDLSFCCDGCKLVYELLDENGLCNYYNISDSPGISKVKQHDTSFIWLDDLSILDTLASFRNENQVHIDLFVPAMHCSSCIWLLENLQKLAPGIISSRVDFPKKKVFVVFNLHEIKLSTIANLMKQIGYEPMFNLSDTATKKTKINQRYYWYKIGVAGFCFGNVMMLSFPEYFAAGETSITPAMRQLFGYLYIALALPVLFYSSLDFFRSAWGALKQKYINIDAPIALALLITFLRSVYDIVFDAGPGYMDTFTALVFFMLIGRMFQNKTFDRLSFERDYKSYFPVAVTRIEKAGERSVQVNDLMPDDLIRLRNKEILPTDSYLISPQAKIDYSFVTGESAIVSKKAGELIYAGAIIDGLSIDCRVKKTVSQSYLTQLWNNTNEERALSHQKNALVTKINLYFSAVVFFIAISAVIFWWNVDVTRAINAFTTILIIACPCALLLSSTFTNGNILRLLGRKGIYLKNAYIIESIRDADVVVFDKTGTITKADESKINYEGKTFSDYQHSIFASAVSQSNHPLSRMLASKFIHQNLISPDYFEEIMGKGIIAYFGKDELLIGSAAFIGAKELDQELNVTKVYVAFNGTVYGKFEFKNAYRKGMQDMIQQLKNMGKEVFLLSGDNDSESSYLLPWFGSESNLHFNCKPDEKKTFVAKLQAQGKKVLMIGDGLNDAGALYQSDAGIAVSDNINNFSPACDGIIKGERLYLFDRIMLYARDSKKVLWTSFGLSLIYNFIGLLFAVQGMLEPVIAAIIMPISSISIILLTTGLSSYYFIKVK